MKWQHFAPTGADKETTALIPHRKNYDNLAGDMASPRPTAPTGKKNGFESRTHLLLWNIKVPPRLKILISARVSDPQRAEGASRVIQLISAAKRNNFRLILIKKVLLQVFR